MRSRSCLLRNCTTMSSPNVKETPRSFSPQPMISRSGSDHSRSHNNPAEGKRVGGDAARCDAVDDVSRVYLFGAALLCTTVVRKRVVCDNAMQL